MWNTDRVAGVKNRIRRLNPEKRRDIGTIQDVLQIVGNRALALQCFVQLIVEGCQFFVEGLQFLFRSDEFPIHRLILSIQSTR